jgi:DNA polymerase IV
MPRIEERMVARPPEPILHADMDAFYASVEQRDDPSLRGRPVVVGGAGGRGVVAAASYEARRFGIHSAMPMVRARRLCPDLVVAAARFDRYTEVSRQVMAIFRDVTPLVEPLSLDEAFLDVGGARRLLGEPVQIAGAIRARVRDDLDLAVSIGVAPTKFLAKLCSGKAKPDGLLHLPAGDVESFLRPLAVSDLWGAGPKTVERLEQYGFRTVGQVADADERTLTRIVGQAMGQQLHRLARGQDERRVIPHEPARFRLQRGDLRPGHRRSRPAPAGDPAPVGEGGLPAAPSRVVGSHDHVEGPVRLVRHRDPVGHPPIADRSPDPRPDRPCHGTVRPSLR